MEARGGARLSSGTFPDPPYALLPTHISLPKKSLDFGSSLMDITVHVINSMVIEKSFAIIFSKNMQKNSKVRDYLDDFNEFKRCLYFIIYRIAGTFLPSYRQLGFLMISEHSVL